MFLLGCKLIVGYQISGSLHHDDGLLEYEIFRKITEKIKITRTTFTVKAKNEVKIIQKKFFCFRKKFSFNRSVPLAHYFLRVFSVKCRKSCEFAATRQTDARTSSRPKDDRLIRLQDTGTQNGNNFTEHISPYSLESLQLLSTLIPIPRSLIG